jgi:UDPglucose 6-dehydrogenase
VVDTDALRVGVIGTGYLGAVHATCMADLGHDVVAVDVDADRIAGLAEGRPDFFEPGLDELLVRALSTGRLRFTTDYAALSGVDVVFLCVGTPQVSGGGRANTGFVFDAARRLAPYLTERTLVVGKSTVPVGTFATLSATLAEETGHAVRLAWNPEFLREGHAIHDTEFPSRLVYGTDGPSALEDAALLDRVYARPLGDGVRRLVTDGATAELVKGSANAFLATKISFINTIADLCEKAGADVIDLAAALGMDDRIGSAFLGAGVGFGGGCLPKDIRGFAARAEELGVPQTADLLKIVDEINLGRRSKVVALATEMLGGTVRDRAVAILGFAFKPDSDDIRDSPALAVATELAAAGARVRVHDPRATLPDDLADILTAATSPAEALSGAEVVLHMTEWPEYRALDPAELVAVVAATNVIDARNRLDARQWRAAGWTYTGLGLRG